MKNFLWLLLVLVFFSCSSKKDDPLIIPPNFAEMPDLNNPQKPDPKQNQENIARLKELLLQSD